MNFNIFHTTNKKHVILRCESRECGTSLEGSKKGMYPLFMPETYHVYILHCHDGSYYVGITNDLERRFAEHQDGKDPYAYTFDKRPVTLVYRAPFTDVRDAIRWEKEVKGWRREKKEALIQKHWEELPPLSRRQHLQRDPSRLADAHASSRTSG